MEVGQDTAASSARKPPVQLPECFVDRWKDPRYVRLPCSDQYCYRKKHDPTIRHKRWALIIHALTEISSGDEFERAINLYQAKPFDMQPFKAFLASLPDDEESTFWRKTLPFIIQLVKETPTLLAQGIMLLTPRETNKVVYSQRALCCIIANQFLCTWPKRKILGDVAYPTMDFSEWFIGSARGGRGRTLSESTRQKIKCIIHYFERLSDRKGADAYGTLVSFQRICAFEPLTRSSWTSSSLPVLRSLRVADAGRIEESGNQHIHVDFANKLIGGGVLRRGCVQEEIMFCVKPELIASRVFVAEIEADEVVVVTGAEQFSNYEGYTSSFRWSGPHQHPRLLDEETRLMSTVLVMDAQKFGSSKLAKLRQYGERELLRELQKATLGFTSAEFQRPKKRHTSDLEQSIATGNWGCGDFNGFHDLKCILQLLAASHAQKPLIYYTFGEPGLAATLQTFHSFLLEHSVTVGRLAEALFDISDQGPAEVPQIFNLLEQALS